MQGFMGDIAFMLEALVLGFGLSLWHLATKEKSNTLYTAGGILCVIAALGMLGTGFNYFFRYADPMQMMGTGMMSGHMMNPRIGMPMNETMMQNMNVCVSKIRGQVMDDVTMKQMQECMIGEISKTK